MKCPNLSVLYYFHKGRLHEDVGFLKDKYTTVPNRFLMSIFTAHIQEAVFQTTQIVDCSPMIKYLCVPSTQKWVAAVLLSHCFLGTSCLADELSKVSTGAFLARWIFFG